jgi:hypothetical protein
MFHHLLQLMFICRRCSQHLRNLTAYITPSTTKFISTATAFSPSPPPASSLQPKRRKNASWSSIPLTLRKETPNKTRPEDPQFEHWFLLYSSTGRRADAISLAQMDYFHLAFNAFGQKNDGARMVRVLEDVMHIWSAPYELKCEAILQLIQSRHFLQLDGATVVNVLQFLYSTESGRNFVKRHLRSISTAILRHPNRWESELSLLRTLYPLLLTNLYRRKPPPSKHLRSLTYVPLPHFAELCELIIRLLNLKEESLALDLFQQLAKDRFVPPEMIQMDSTVSAISLRLVITSALAKTLLHFNFRLHAIKLLTGVFNFIPLSILPPNSLLNLVDEAILTCLDTPSSGELSALVTLITKMHDHRPVPYSTIRKFYKRSVEAKRSDPACKLFIFTLQSDKGIYPYPPGAVALSLMRRLRSSPTEARILAAQAADGNIVLPVQDRAPFIALVATYGFATSARRLWELYTVGDDKVHVTGHATLMIRLVSLFTTMAQREIAIAESSHLASSGEEIGEQRAEAKQDGKVTGQMDGIFGEHVEAITVEEPLLTSKGSTGPLMENEATGDSGLTDAYPMSERSDISQRTSTSTGKPLEPSDDDAFDPLGSTLDLLNEGDYRDGHIPNAEEDLDAGFYSEKEKDFTTFARTVIAEYEGAAHRKGHLEFSSLARAKFIMGDLKGGITMLKRILQQQMVPDLVDINICLSALAERSPRAAWQMIRKMAATDIKPNGITFGTVIHQASRHHDQALVSTILRAMTTSPSRMVLTSKSLHSLVRASTSSNVLAAMGRTVALQRLVAIRVMITKHYSADPTVATVAMGKWLMNAALQCKHPQLAFQFWKLLIKGKEGWDDEEHTSLRIFTINMFNAQRGTKVGSKFKKIVPNKAILELRGGSSGSSGKDENTVQ